MSASDPKVNQAFVASCDSGYLHSYGPAFVASALRTDNAVHLHVVNPKSDDEKLLARMAAFHPQLSYTFGMYDNSKHPGAVYASARYHYVADLLERRRDFKAFVMDIDTIFRRRFEHHPLDHPIGLYLRDPIAHGARTPDEIKGMRVLAVCWIWGEAAAYARAVSDYLKTHEPRWFIDQEALAECHDRMRDTLAVTDLSKGYVIDWEMRPHTVLWSAKGDRKHTNLQFRAALETETRAFYAR